MATNHHYTGLTDAQVLESRAKYGTNVLTPPEETSFWQQIKDCMHFWLLKVYLVIFVITALAATVLPLAGIYNHEGLWIAPVLSFILSSLTYLVTFLGGKWNEKEEEFIHLVLNDKSEDIMNREESVLSADKWMGAVYQELIQTSAGGHTYYTLLGWNGVDNITDRKIIEPVTIRNGRLQFGAPLFRRERNLRRIILEYSNAAAVNLSFETQYVQEVERKREKVKGTNRYHTVEKTKEHQEKMIIFDEVEPQVPGMEGLFQYYSPSGVEVAYSFVDGKWERRKGAQGRLTDKKLNKNFEPLPKSAPSYQFGTKNESK